VVEQYEYNDDFVVVKGHEYFVNGELNFPPDEEEMDGTYRTVFGPAVSHTGQIYSNTNHNFKYAMRRLTGIRKPEIPGLHCRLLANQAAFINTHQSFLDKLRNSYSPYFDDYKGAELEALEHHADPHIKRILRIQAYRELVEQALATDDSSLWVKSVLWKLKKNEWAKPGKKPRSIGDLGVAAFLLGFRVTSFLKGAQSEEVIDVNGGSMVFCKSPDPFELSDISTASMTRLVGSTSCTFLMMLALPYATHVPGWLIGTILTFPPVMRHIRLPCLKLLNPLPPLDCHVMISNV